LYTPANDEDNRGRDCTDDKLLTLDLLPQKACPFCMKHKRSGREREGEGEGDNRAITTLKKDLWYGDI
jgi:hypothetical protein